MRRPPPVVCCCSSSFLALGLVAQIVPLYTDWLWFDEVGYSERLRDDLSLRGALFTAVAGRRCSSSCGPT